MTSSGDTSCNRQMVRLDNKHLYIICNLLRYQIDLTTSILLSYLTYLSLEILDQCVLITIQTFGHYDVVLVSISIAFALTYFRWLSQQLK